VRKSENVHLWGETIPIPSVEALGKAIYKCRNRHHVSQRNLSVKTGVAPSAISRLELEGDESIPLGLVLRVIEALELDLELRPRGSKFTPRPPTKLHELGLSPNTMSALRKERLEDLAQLSSAASMLSRTRLHSGIELYEIVCALNRYGLSLPMSRPHQVPGDRDREIFRLRIVDGLMLSEIAQLHDVNVERVRQILTCFGLAGAPPAASRRRKEKARERQRGPRA
jgi:transcriptional regulator with XRE-family HTH domain